MMPWLCSLTSVRSEDVTNASVTSCIVCRSKTDRPPLDSGLFESALVFLMVSLPESSLNARRLTSLLVVLAGKSLLLMAACRLWDSRATSKPRVF